MSEDLLNVDLHKVGGYIRRRLWIAIAGSLIIAAAVYFFLKHHPTYQCRAVLSITASENNALFPAPDPADLVELANAAGLATKIKGDLPIIRVETTLQKKVILTVRGKDPGQLIMFMPAWIDHLRQKYRSDLKNELTEMKEHEQKVFDALTAQFQTEEEHYREFLNNEKPAVLLEQIKAAQDQYNQLLSTEMKNQETSAELHDMLRNSGIDRKQIKLQYNRPALAALTKKTQEQFVQLMKQSVSVLSRDQRYTADMNEIRKNLDMVRARIIQIDTWIQAPPESIRILSMSTTAQGPLYPAVKWAVVIGILSLGILSVLFSLRAICRSD